MQRVQARLFTFWSNDLSWGAQWRFLPRELQAGVKRHGLSEINWWKFVHSNIFLRCNAEALGSHDRKSFGRSHCHFEDRDLLLQCLLTQTFANLNPSMMIFPIVLQGPKFDFRRSLIEMSKKLQSCGREARLSLDAVVLFQLPEVVGRQCKTRLTAQWGGKLMAKLIPTNVLKITTVLIPNAGNIVTVTGAWSCFVFFCVHYSTFRFLNMIRCVWWCPPGGFLPGGCVWHR